MDRFAITLENVTKRYRPAIGRKPRAAVEDLSFRVPEGRIFGLLGPNGAGKTTTIKVLLGLVFPDSGGGTVLGRGLGDRSAHQRLGFLPEETYFHGFLTAEKGLALYGRFFGLRGRELEEKTAELLELVRLPAGSHLTLGKYSKGMVQRFGIAQALVNDPDLLVLDEPSSGLDPVGQKEVRDILLRLKERGKTIFLSSHQLSEVENICDSVTILKAGRAVKEGDLADLLAVEGRTFIRLRGEPGAGERLRPLARDLSFSDGEVRLEVEESEAFRALDAARELGLELVSVSPRRLSLEDLFLETVRGGGL